MMKEPRELLRKVALGAICAFVGVAIVISVATLINNPDAIVSPSSSGGLIVVDSEGEIVSIDKQYMTIAVDENEGDFITLSLNLSRGWPMIRGGANFEDFEVGNHVYFSYFMSMYSTQPYGAYELGFEPRPDTEETQEDLPWRAPLR